MNERTSNFTVAAADFLVKEFGASAGREAAEIVLIHAAVRNWRGRTAAAAILQVVIALQNVAFSGLLN